MAIQLKKGGSINLGKGDQLKSVRFGLGWDPIKKSSGGGLFGMFKQTEEVAVDLDASCIVYENGRCSGAAYFGKLKLFEGAISHSGDNLTGAGDGDDEVITVDLTRVPESVNRLLLTISSYRGQTFDLIENAVCNIADHSGKTLATFEMSGKEAKTGLIVGEVVRNGGDWAFNAIGEFKNGRTFQDLAA